MTLAPARPQYAPSDPGGAEPTVVAVLLTRRDPQGLADLLDAVLTQSLTPDSVLVLDRTEGRVLPPAAHSPRPAAMGPYAAGSAVSVEDASTGDDDDWSLVIPDEPPDAPDLVADDVAAIVRAVASRHGISVSIRPVDPQVPLRTAVHRVLLSFDDADGAESGAGNASGDASGDGDASGNGAASRHRNAPGDRDATGRGRDGLRAAGDRWGRGDR